MAVATQEQVDNLIIGGRKLRATEYVAAIDEVMAKNITSLLDRLGIDLVEKLQQNIPVSSGALADSISVLGVREYKGGYRLEIGFGVDYHDYIDKGVKGIDNIRRTSKNSDGRYYQFKTYGMPPEALRGLKEWARMKNIELEGEAQVEQAKTGRKKKLKKIDMGASRLAYYIKKYGIEGRNYKKKSIDAVTKDYQVELETIGYNALILKITR